MDTDRLEKLSDDVRLGIPISLQETLEVIEYQNKLKKVKVKERKSFILTKLLDFYNSIERKLTHRSFKIRGDYEKEKETQKGDSS